MDAMDEGATALMLACQNGHVEAARLLLEKGAAVDANDEHDATASSYTPAMRATSRRRALLLEKGAAVDAKDEQGLTPLVWRLR